jgi:hypothetical protein
MPSREEQQAGHLRNTVPALFMYASVLPAFGQIDEGAFKIYRNRLLADCGSPSDPVEVMVIGQLALAHLNLGLLQCRAANARKAEATWVYATAAARLMAEFRRSALALQAYRAAARQLARDPSRDIIIPAEEADPTGERSAEKGIDSEQDATREILDDGIIPYPGPAALGDQPPQPAEMAGHEPRGKGKAPRRRAAEPPLGEVHRAAER